jgi:hypothetical protein
MTKAFPYIAVVQKLLDLLLNFLISSGLVLYAAHRTVWQCHSRDQVNLMLNSSQRWQPRGILAEKMSLNSCKRLVIMRGKGIVI